MNDASRVGTIGEAIARHLWPTLRPVPPGGDEDRLGCDAYDGPLKIQIKADERIAKTGNLYFEIYEKTKGFAEQRWRHSPMSADEYIFITTGHAYRIDLNTAVKAIVNKSVRKIRDTSVGFLVPLGHFETVIVKEHPYWVDNPPPLPQTTQPTLFTVVDKPRKKVTEENYVDGEVTVLEW